MFHYSFGSSEKEFDVSAELDPEWANRGEVLARIKISEKIEGRSKTHHLVIRASEETGTAEVYAQDQRLAEIPLDQDLPDPRPEVDPADQIIAGNMPDAPDFAGILIALDPLTGCLAKGAATTVVVEIIRCWQSVGPRPTFGERARETGNCLRANGWGLALSFIKRVAVCLVRLGLI